MSALRTTIIVAAIPALLSACSVQVRQDVEKDYAPAQPVDVSHVPDATPRKEPRSRYGNPKSYVVNGREYYVMNSAAGYQEKGIASWYGMKFHGRRTSSGEPYDMYKMTAAHKSLPLPTYVRVRNLQNGKSAVLKVNDRGPFHSNRIIDLSYAAASRLGILKSGTGLVEVTAIDPDKHSSQPTAQTVPQNPIDKVWIQIGAFGNEQNALKLRYKMTKEFDLPIRITQHENLHRVAIGPIKSLEILDAVTEDLVRLGITRTHLITE